MSRRITEKIFRQYIDRTQINNTEPVTVPDTEFEIEIEQDEPERFSHIEEQAAKY